MALHISNSPHTCRAIRSIQLEACSLSYAFTSELPSTADDGNIFVIAAHRVVQKVGSKNRHNFRQAGAWLEKVTLLLSGQECVREGSGDSGDRMQALPRAAYQRWDKRGDSYATSRYCARRFRPIAAHSPATATAAFGTMDLVRGIVNNP